jgi:hypothetical protein
MSDTTTYDDGTYLTRETGPFSAAFIAGAALCPDGRVRRLKRLGLPDTMFSVPAAVTVNGRTVTGFVTVQTRGGFSTASDDDPMIVRFIPHSYGRNADVFEVAS